MTSGGSGHLRGETTVSTFLNRVGVRHNVYYFLSESSNARSEGNCILILNRQCYKFHTMYIQYTYDMQFLVHVDDAFNMEMRAN